jgi:hypothetical protein
MPPKRKTIPKKVKDQAEQAGLNIEVVDNRIVIAQDTHNVAAAVQDGMDEFIVHRANTFMYIAKALAKHAFPIATKVATMIAKLGTELAKFIFKIVSKLIDKVTDQPLQWAMAFLSIQAYYYVLLPVVNVTYLNAIHTGNLLINAVGAVLGYASTVYEKVSSWTPTFPSPPEPTVAPVAAPKVDDEHRIMPPPKSDQGEPPPVSYVPADYYISVGRSIAQRKMIEPPKSQDSNIPMIAATAVFAVGIGLLGFKAKRMFDDHRKVEEEKQTYIEQALRPERQPRTPAISQEEYDYIMNLQPL